MQIVDSHCHYWEPPSLEHPYDPHGLDLGAPYSVEALLSESEAAGVTKVAQVTPSCMGFDNDYAFAGAVKYADRVAGVFVRFNPIGVDMQQRLARGRRHPKFWG